MDSGAACSGGWLGGFHVDEIAGMQHARRPPGRAIHQHAAALDPVLQAGTAEFGKLLVERVVQAFTGVLAGGGKLHRYSV